MKGKDPAFLFYSKDWIEGTAEMMPNEKGVYIDLLCFQHQRGDLPNDIRRLSKMVGLGVDEFNEIWKVIGCKFEANGERTLNRKLSEVMGERADKGNTNRIIGIFGGLCKKSGIGYNELASIRSQFKVADFKEIESERLSETISEWFDKRIALLEDGNGIEDINTTTKLNKVEHKYFQSDELNEVFSKWLYACANEVKPAIRKAHGQSAIEALAMKLNCLPVDTAIKQVRQSLENGWVTLRPVDESKLKPDPNAPIIWEQKDIDDYMNNPFISNETKAAFLAERQSTNSLKLNA